MVEQFYHEKKESYDEVLKQMQYYQDLCAKYESKDITNQTATKLLSG